MSFCLPFPHSWDKEAEQDRGVWKGNKKKRVNNWMMLQSHSDTHVLCWAITSSTEERLLYFLLFTSSFFNFCSATLLFSRVMVCQCITLKLKLQHYANFMHKFTAASSMSCLLSVVCSMMKPLLWDCLTKCDDCVRNAIHTILHFPGEQSSSVWAATKSQVELVRLVDHLC